MAERGKAGRKLRELGRGRMRIVRLRRLLVCKSGECSRKKRKSRK